MNSSKERLKEFKNSLDFLDDSADMEDYHRLIDTLKNLYKDGELGWIHRYAREQSAYLHDRESENRALKKHIGQQTQEIEDLLSAKSLRVQELEKEFELCDSTIHMIDMAINNPSTSDDGKWEKVNKIIKKYYADDCIHCNGKGFNGLDYCTKCKALEGDPHD